MENTYLEKIRNHQELSRRELIILSIQLSLPAILAQLSSVIMQYADSSMVGRLGAVDSAGIGLVSTTTWLLNGLSTAFGTGFTVQVAHRIGAKEDSIARDVVKHGLVSIVVLSGAVASVGLLVRTVLPVWLGGAPDVAAQSTKYFSVYCFGIPFMAVRFTSGGMIQSTGNMRVPSVVNVGMCFLNVCLNFLLIFPAREITIGDYSLALPGAGLGIVGASTATVLSEVTASIAMLTYLLLGSPQLKLRRSEKTSFSPEIIRRAVKIALPVGFESLGHSTAQVAFTRIAATLGTISIAANSFCFIAESICFMPAYGVQVAATTLVGQSIGAGRKDLAKRLASLNVAMGMALIACTATIMFAFAPVMLGLLTPVREIQVLAVRALRIVAISEPFYCASVVCVGGFRGAGDTLTPSIMIICSMWIIRLPLAFFMAAQFGLPGMWGAMAFEVILRGTVFILRLRRGKWLNAY